MNNYTEKVCFGGSLCRKFTSKNKYGVEWGICGFHTSTKINFCRIRYIFNENLTKKIRLEKGLKNSVKMHKKTTI